jgi:hypothetical protein
MLPAIRLLQIGQRKNNPVPRPLTSSSFPLLDGTDDMELSHDELQFLATNGMSAADLPSLVRRSRTKRSKRAGGENPYQKREAEVRRKKAVERRKRMLAVERKQKQDEKDIRNAEFEQRMKAEKARRKKITRALEQNNIARMKALGSAKKKEKADEAELESQKADQRRMLQLRMSEVYADNSFAGVAKEEERLRIVALEKAAKDKMIRARKREEQLELQEELDEVRRNFLETKIEEGKPGGLNSAVEEEIEQEAEEERRRQRARKKKRELWKR